MTTAPLGALSRFVENWTPAPKIVHDNLVPASAQHLAATLDLDYHPDGGASLPLLWHWVYFTDWAPTADLGDDGHPRDGHFLPPVPERRRMFAGGRLTVTAPLVLGTPAQRHTRIAAVTQKIGRSGAMLLVTVQHEYRQNGALAIVEEQDIVYRSGGGAVPGHTRATPPFTEPVGGWTIRPITTAPLLFRFSALTANAHRIHYDQPYATTAEGYPDLVVHGPLLAIYMAEVTRRFAPDRSVMSFEFRIVKPVFVGDPIEATGFTEGDSLTLSVNGSDHREHASARAAFS